MNKFRTRAAMRNGARGGFGFQVFPSIQNALTPEQVGTAAAYVRCLYKNKHSHSQTHLLRLVDCWWELCNGKICRAHSNAESPYPRRARQKKQAFKLHETVKSRISRVVKSLYVFCRSAQDFGVIMLQATLPKDLSTLHQCPLRRSMRSFWKYKCQKTLTSEAGSGLKSMH